jgi:Na+/alanine symporter
MGGEPFVVLGLIFVMIALDLQPWHRRFRNPLLALGGCFIIGGLASILPALKFLIPSIPIFFWIFSILIIALLIFWRIALYVEHRMS